MENIWVILANVLEELREGIWVLDDLLSELGEEGVLHHSLEFGELLLVESDLGGASWRLVRVLVGVLLGLGIV